MKQVGIFSGTFDPVHNGHIQVALDAASKYKLDRVFFLVEPRPRRKQGVKAYEHRLNMVQLATSNNPVLGSIVLEQQQFTAQHTLPVLEARFAGAQIHLLMGDDMLSHLSDWPDVDRLIHEVVFVICSRVPGRNVTGQIKLIEQTRGLRIQYKTFTSRLPDVSSSKVKQRFRTNQDLPDVPLAVLNYIKEHKLYTADSSVS